MTTLPIYVSLGSNGRENRDDWEHCRNRVISFRSNFFKFFENIHIIGDFVGLFWIYKFLVYYAHKGCGGSTSASRFGCLRLESWSTCVFVLPRCCILITYTALSVMIMKLGHSLNWNLRRCRWPTLHKAVNRENTCFFYTICIVLIMYWPILETEPAPIDILILCPTQIA